MKKSIITIAGVIILAVAYWLLSPLFIDEVVDEAFPPKASDVIGPVGESILEPGDIRPADGVVPLPLPIGTNLEEQLAPEMMEEFKEEMVKVEEEVEMIEDMPTEAAVSSRILKRGSFIDVAHQGSGNVQVIPFGDNESLVRIENLDVSNGPDLRVLLSKEQNVRSSGDLGEYIELGKLKGNKGNQNYEIPEGIDVSEYHSVIIYCKPFSVVFNSADLE